MRQIKFDVFGRLVLAMQTKVGWKMYYVGKEGKRRPASDIVVPGDITESNLDKYLADLRHEWSTERNPVVKRLV
jgi:hypothetical protein